MNVVGVFAQETAPVICQVHGAGQTLPGPDGPYFSVSLDLPRQASVVFVRAFVPEPGNYTVVVVMNAPEFASREDQRSEHRVTFPGS